MEPHEDRIQPTINQKMIVMSNDNNENDRPNMRKNSLSKSLSQVSIISSLLNEDEKRFLGATKNDSNLYSTPQLAATESQKINGEHALPSAMSPTTMGSLSPDLKPLSVNSVSPEPVLMTTKPPQTTPKASTNSLQGQERNLQLPPGCTSQSISNMQQEQHQQQQPPTKSLHRRFSMIVWLGAVQLIVSIVLVALGGLVIARGASLAGSCAGVWTGAIAGLTGAFGIMGEIRKARTAFLACSLICVASSTLALALTGIGAVRDTNLAQQDETKWNAVSGGVGLIIVLVIHFIASMVSVYHSALKLCSGQNSQGMLIMENSDQSTLSKNNVEEYIQSIAADPNLRGMLYHNLLHRNMVLNQQNEKANGTLKQGSERMGSQRSSMKRHPILLVPAGLAPPPMMYGAPQPVYHPNMLPPGYVPTSPEPAPTHFMHPQELEYLYRSTRSLHSMSGGHQNQMMMDSQREEERQQKKWEKRQRREQERQAAFTYTGLDRDIAESYLEQQEKSARTSESMSSSVTSSSSSADEDYQRKRRYGDVAM